MSRYSLPPRQKMINLLYVILIAMLAINISSDVLDGYKLMNDDYGTRLQTFRDRRDSLAVEISRSGDADAIAASNSLSARTDSVCLLLDGLREQVAMRADEDKYRPGHLKASDDLNAVPDVFLSMTDRKGKALHDSLAIFKSEALSLIENPAARSYAASFLRLENKKEGVSWENEMFSYLPAIGGITILNRMEEDVLLICNEVQNSIIESLRERGHEGEEDGRYVLINSGQKIVNEDGTVEGPVVLLTPSAAGTIYRGYENRIDIFCAGLPLEDLILEMKNGRISRKGDVCIAVPDNNAKYASVSARMRKEGRLVKLFDARFKVKDLPVPYPYLVLDDLKNGVNEYKGNVPVAKESLQYISMVAAETDEGPDFHFTVKSFETVIIKADSNKVISARSSGETLTKEQIGMISGIEPGDRLYFTGITVSDNAGRTMQIAPINVVIM